MNTNGSTHACPKCGAAVPADAPQGLCPRCVLACAARAAEVQRSATATGEIPSLERVAAAFPALEVVELVGRGAMGFVFKVRQPHLDRFVALKLLPDKLARDPRFAERFNREGRVLARLNHPNIVSVFDFGRTEHFYFLLMEFVDGVNLRQAMQAGRFSPSEALAIVPKICEALQYAHEQGVLHRDIKPENILLDARGRVKIADFGIAKLVGEDQPSVTLTGTGAALGTPHYMAPEQLERPSEVDHRADVYSLGVVFYEMLTGELPIGRFAPAVAHGIPMTTAPDSTALTGGGFAPTRWTLVLQARGETAEARGALSELCEAYYSPVFRFLCREGRDDDTARELAQEFFARILQRGELGGADPARGRFRSYLLGAVKHFLADQRKHDRRVKRGGALVPESLDGPSPGEGPAVEVPDAGASVPEAWFDREWALTVMDRALAAVEDEFKAAGKAEQFDRLKPWLVGETEALSQAEAARQLGLNEGAVKVAIHRLRKRFRELIRAEIVQTVADGTDIDAELRYLVEVLTA